MEREIKGLSDGSTLAKEHILGGQHSLGGHIVGVHTLPTTRDGTTVEDDLETIAVGIGEDILVEAHRLLLVASEEVDLDALDADALHPLHLAFAGNGGVHAVARTLRGIVPETVGVVPQHEVDAL